MQCRTECDSGYLADDAIPCVPAVHLIAPLASYRVTGRRPLLHWNGPASDDEVRVELCADRACSMSMGVIDTTGTTATPGADLPAGPVFWRVRARSGMTLATHVSPTWEVFVGHGTAAAGRVGGPVLDLNGDGFVDMAVLRDDKVEVHLGSGSGLSHSPSFTLTGTGSGYDDWVGAAGDVNGDGFGDLLVGKVTENSIYVFLGRSDIGAMGPTATVMSGHYRQIGRRPRGVGDLDGDGFGDIASGSNGSGGIGVFYGSAGGVSNRETDFDGPWVFAGGDVNGDGFSDLVTELNDLHQTAVVYAGSASGLATTPLLTLNGAENVTDITLDGDINGDGLPDIVTTPSFGETLRIYSGGPTAPATSAVLFTASIDSTNNDALATNGDVNADGFDDVLVGAVYYEPGGLYQAGGAYVIFGAATALAQPTGYLAQGTDADAYLGSSIAILGDTDRDGFDDLAVTAPNARPNGMMNGGQAFVFRGGTTILPTPSLTIDGATGDTVRAIASLRSVPRPRAAWVASR